MLSTELIVCRTFQYRVGHFNIALGISILCLAWYNVFQLVLLKWVSVEFEIMFYERQRIRLCQFVNIVVASTRVFVA